MTISGQEPPAKKIYRDISKKLKYICDNNRNIEDYLRGIAHK